MDQVKLIIKTYLSSGSYKATSRRLGVSKNTVRRYVRRAQSHEKDLSTLLQLSEEELSSILYLPANEALSLKNREAIFSQKSGYWIKELSRVGVTRQLLWQEYREEYPDGYGYSQFCERLKAEIGRRDLSLSIIHSPGEVMQVDFAGKRMRWVDIHTGEVEECEVLIAVLPYSQQTFATALPSQKVVDFITGLNEALLYFGKLPKAILSDNLKSYVTRSDRYEPHFNELCSQLAAHYEIDLQATRVGKPKDKASVENMVSNVYRRIYAPLRNEVFHSIEQINQAIRNQLKAHNAKAYQKRAGCRQEVFETEELPVMRDLPGELFEVKKITKAKVQRNYHVFLGEEKNFYSVPFQYVGKQTSVVYTSKVVEIYLGHKRIAIHERLLGRGSYLHKTNEVHMPKSHQEWKQAQGYDAAYFLKEAEKIGPSALWAIGYILASRIHESQSYNSCRGVLSLAKKHSNERLERAALRCKEVEKTSYTMLKRILEHKLDQQAEEAKLFSSPQHENIRGPEAYR